MPGRLRTRSGWPLDLTDGELRDPDSLDELFGLAVNAGWVERSQAGRLKFFTAACHALEHGAAPAKLLTSNLANGRWYGDDAAEQRALAMIREADHIEQHAREPPADDEPAEDDRVRQQRMLAEFQARRATTNAGTT